MSGLYLYHSDRPTMPRDYAYMSRSTDRAPEEGPLSWTLGERVFFVVSFVVSALVVAVTLYGWLGGA